MTSPSSTDKSVMTSLPSVVEKTNRSAPPFPVRRLSPLPPRRMSARSAPVRLSLASPPLIELRTPSAPEMASGRVALR